MGKEKCHGFHGFSGIKAYEGFRLICENPWLVSAFLPDKTFSVFLPLETDAAEGVLKQ
jgi:hypothetical protein